MFVGQVWASPYQVAHALAVVERVMDTVPALRAAPEAPQAAAVAAEVRDSNFMTVPHAD